MVSRAFLKFFILQTFEKQPGGENLELIILSIDDDGSDVLIHENEDGEEDSRDC